MAFTVTATQHGSTGNGMEMVVAVLTGFALPQPGAVASVQSTTPSLAITPQYTGSYVFGSIVALADAFVALSGTTIINDTPRSGLELGSVRSTSTQTAGTPVTIGSSATGANSIGVALCEIAPQGTLTISGTGPAAAGSGATTATTAAFTPPAGSLLVAMIETNGGAGVVTVTVTDTSGLGITWTQQSVANGAGKGYAGVWTGAVIPTQVAPPPVPPGFSSPASFFYTWRPRQAPVTVLSPVTGAAAVSGIMAGGRVVSDPLTGAAAASGSFSGVVAGPALVYYPRLPGPVVRPISYASPGAQVPLTAYAAASGKAAAARTANAAPAGAAAAGAVMAGQKQAAAQLAGNAAALAAISGFELGAGPAAAGYAAASGMFASARTATASVAGFAGAALLSSPRSSRHGLITGYAAVTGAAFVAPVTPVAAPVRTGSWWQLLDIRRHAQEEFEFYASRPPMACPRDGEPLLNAPPTDAGSDTELYCRFCGWQYPRDYVRPQML